MQQVTVNGKTYNIHKLLGKGKGGYVYGVEYDNSGDAWYNVKVLSNGTESAKI